ncbi:MAG: DUF4123 domain-containing protein [Gammaproteobacteria bacterium]|nr:DUF4123 domain-containing protein [Gammaproteobacteria bacterium]
MATPEQAENLRKCLYANPDFQVYGLLDGASNPALIDHLYDDDAEFFCLFSGKLEPDMAEVAPYLVRMDPGSRFSDWVIRESPGNHWGVFVQSSQDLRAMRKHFRQFLQVMSPEGKPLFFRFYDPRVLRVYLPTCNEEESELWFEGLSGFLMESDEPGTLIRIHPESGLPKISELST